MIVRENEIPEIYDDSSEVIMCKCGQKIKVSLYLHLLYLDKGIDFKCSCGRWLHNGGYKYIGTNKL